MSEWGCSLHVGKDREERSYEIAAGRVTAFAQVTCLMESRNMISTLQSSCKALAHITRLGHQPWHNSCINT